jgi:hypothetical protein
MFIIGPEVESVAGHPPNTFTSSDAGCKRIIQTNNLEQVKRRSGSSWSSAEGDP